MRRSWLLGALALTVSVCSGCGDDGGSAPPPDGGDGGGGLCAADEGCDDGLFCNGAERCDPSAGGANDRGCLAGTAPCAAAQRCDEEADECITDCGSDADADGDGHAAIACGGDDCDDSSAARFPGNTEVCDRAGLDEDCDPTTLAGAADRDVDGDGTVSDECCNLQPDGTLLCGEDCDDAAEGVNPGTPESCNMVDDDCDGEIDEGVGTTCFTDADGDDFPAAGSAPMSACSCGAGLTDRDPADASDCNDADAAIGACALGLCSEGACHPLHDWSDGYGDAGIDKVAAVGVDQRNNVYITGSFEGRINFGDGPADALDAGETPAIFVASFNDAGTHRWSRSFGGGAGSGSDGDAGTALVTTDTGVFVAGHFDGTIDFGAIRPVNAASGEDRGFLAAFDGADGSVIWVDHFGSGELGDSLAPAGLALGAHPRTTGRIALMTGSFEGTVDFGGGALTSAGGPDIFVAGFALADGAHVASERFGASGFANESGAAVATDPADDVYLAGHFGGDVDFGGGTLSPEGFGDVFLVKLDAGLSHVWSKSLAGSSSSNRASDLEVDADGNVYLTGSFQESIDLGGGATSSAGASDGFLASFDSSGAHRWSKTFGAEGDDQANAVDVRAGDVVITGGFEGAADFGGGSVEASENRDVLLASYDASGAHRFSRGFGGGGSGGVTMASDTGSDVVFARIGGNILLTGTFENSIDLGGGAIDAAGQRDLFVAQFLP